MQSVTQSIRKIQRRVLDGVVKHHPSLGLDRRAEYFVRQFEKTLAPQSRILDIGGGWGFYADPLEQRGHKVTVLDVVRPGIQKAPVIIYDGGEKFPFPARSFDACLLITVLHHIESPEKVLREARRVTRKNLIVVEDVYHHSLGRLWTQWRDQLFNFEFAGHPCRFHKGDEWAAIFKSVGFTVVKRKKMYTWLSGLRILNELFILEVD